MEEEKEKGAITTKKVDEAKEKRKPGALINVRVSALHSKGNKAELNRRYGVHHSTKRANGKVLSATWILSTGGMKRCHLICEFMEGGMPVQHTIHVGQVTYGHVEVDPFDNPLYHPPSVAATAATAAAAAAAATTTTATPFSVACEGGIADVDATQTTPAPGQSPSPTAANITGATFATGGGRHFASPAAFSDVSSKSPAPFKFPAGYVGKGIPVECISSETKEHGEVFYTAPNGQKWYKPEKNKPIFINEGAPDIKFSVEDRFGNSYSADDGNPPMTKLQAWLMMYGSDSMESFFANTNVQLKARGFKEMKGYSEAIKFQGVMRLCTRFEFSDRDKLWSTRSENKFVDAPNFGKKTGMFRDRFKEIFICQRYSKQPTTRPEDVSSEQYRWMLVDDHVLLFNKNRAKIITPTGTIVVDESISRWYGIGGDWINAGLPMYIAMDRKPEDGCEIQDSCDGETGIMLQLKLVKTKTEEDRIVDEKEGDSDTKIAKGTKVVLKLVEPWTNTDTPRIVLGDSAFASLPTCDAMKENGLRFMGPIKTAHKGFCHKVFNKYVLTARGEYHGLYTIDDNGVLDKMAYMWLDRNRMQFISNASHLYDGGKFYRVRLRQVDTTPNADPEKVMLEIEQPEVTAIYYKGNAQIDEHNRTRQQVIQLETKLKVKEWHLRVNHTILGINDVDTYRVGKALGWWKSKMGAVQTPLQFYNDLIEEMIDNNMVQSQTSRTCTQPCAQSELDKSLRSKRTHQPVLSLETSRKRRRSKNPDGSYTEYPNQVERLVCTERGCKKKTPKLCTLCARPVCDFEMRPGCWQNHCETYHKDMIE